MSTAGELLAYSVQGYENGCIVFAKHNVVARREGALDIDCDFEDVESCRRAPQFDQYAPGPVPVRALMENGWWWECFGCTRKLHGIDDNEDEDGNELDLYFPDDRSVFCSKACYESAVREREQRKQAETKLREDFLRRYPGCTIRHCYGTPAVNSLTFDFPGGKYGGRWDADDPNHVSVAQGEVEVWKTYRKIEEAPEQPPA